MDAGAMAPVTVTVDVGRLGVDIAAVDWLARLALLTRRHEVLFRDRDSGRPAGTHASPQQ
jgi:hypothetical protein